MAPQPSRAPAVSFTQGQLLHYGVRCTTVDYIQYTFYWLFHHQTILNFRILYDKAIVLEMKIFIFVFAFHATYKCKTYKKEAQIQEKIQLQVQAQIQEAKST